MPPKRLPDEALRRGAVLLTTDAEALDRRIVADGSLRVVWLPTSLLVEEKLALVFRDLGLTLRDPRCMACGGALVARAKDARRRAHPAAHRALEGRVLRVRGLRPALLAGDALGEDRRGAAPRGERAA